MLYMLLTLVVFALFRVVVCEVQTNAELPAIEIQGSKFFYSNNDTQFFIKGIVYQPDLTQYDDINHNVSGHYIDPLAYPAMCARDVPLLKELGVNTVRVYSLDPTLNHNECMKIFASADIYVAIDLSEPKMSIVRESPGWNQDLLERYTDVVDAMHGYTNVLGFFAGNEVITDESNLGAAPFVKASVRDVKQYIRKMKYRRIPVGYSTNDEQITRDIVKDYLVCDDGGNQNDAHIDFYGLNIYEWCGYSTYATSGYRDRTIEYAEYPVPVFFSEFGCNVQRPRPFTEVDALFGPLMSGVWSGGIVYMFFEETNQYGVVKLEGDFLTGKLEKLPEFANLKKKYSKAAPMPVTRNKAALAESKPRPCAKDIGVSSMLPHTPKRSRCDCMMSSLECIIKEDIPQDVRLKHLDAICDDIYCGHIESDGTRGVYGLFATCTEKQRVSIAANMYYHYHDDNPDYCDFNGHGILIKERPKIETLFGLTADDGTTCRSELLPGVKKMSDIVSNFSMLQKGCSRSERSRTRLDEFTRKTEVDNGPQVARSYATKLTASVVVIFTSLLIHAI